VSDKGYFVGTLQNARAWDKPMAWIRVNGTALHSRIDSGADVTVISHDFKRLPNTCLSKSDLSQLGPEKRPLDVMGKMNSTLSTVTQILYRMCTFHALNSTSPRMASNQAHEIIFAFKQRRSG